MSTREKRVELIQKLEEKTKSRVIVYFMGDRPLIVSQIAEDAVRPMYDHIRAIADFPSKKKKLSLYLYSRGGQMEVPWKIVTMFRSHSDGFDVIIPYKAYSAATMISLGADKIWMSRKAELGPIDPSLQPTTKNIDPNKPGPFVIGELGTEDVAAYVRFLRERAGLNDQDAIARMMQLLAENTTPVLLGRVERIYSHIRLVANKLLSQHKPSLNHQQINQIIEALTEKSYVHGHGIGRDEAKEIGLDILMMDQSTEELAWELYLEYEKLTKLNSPNDAKSYFPNEDTDAVNENSAVLACIESVKKCHTFTGNVEFKKIRKPSQQPLNINVNLAMPPNVSLANMDPKDAKPIIQTAVQESVNQALDQIKKIVEAEHKKLSPIEGITVNVLNGLWREC